MTSNIFSFSFNSSSEFGVKVTFKDGTTSFAVVYPNSEIFIWSLDDSISFRELKEFGVAKVDLA